LPAYLTMPEVLLRRKGVSVVPRCQISKSSSDSRNDGGKDLEILLIPRLLYWFFEPRYTRRDSIFEFMQYLCPLVRFYIYVIMGMAKWFGVHYIQVRMVWFCSVVYCKSKEGLQILTSLLKWINDERWMNELNEWIDLQDTTIDRFTTQGSGCYFSLQCLAYV